MREDCLRHCYVKAYQIFKKQPTTRVVMQPTRGKEADFPKKSGIFYKKCVHTHYLLQLLILHCLIKRLQASKPPPAAEKSRGFSTFSIGSQIIPAGARPISLIPLTNYTLSFISDIYSSNVGLSTRRETDEGFQSNANDIIATTEVHVSTCTEEFSSRLAELSGFKNRKSACVMRRMGQLFSLLMYNTLIQHKFTGWAVCLNIHAGQLQIPSRQQNSRQVVQELHTGY